MKHYLYLTAICLLFVMAGACTRTTQKYNEGSVMLYADEGFQNFIEQEREVFEYQYPGAYVITNYMSELDVINGLLKDSCALGVVSRKLTQKQIDYIREHNKKIVRQEPIAVDAVALIVNKENPIDGLSVQDIKDLFSGEIDTWRQMGWNDTTQIRIAFDREGSANVSYIEENFLPKGGKFRPNVYAQGSSQDVIKLVEQDKAAIGLISVSWLGDNLERVRGELSKENLDSNKIKDLEEETTDKVVIDFTDKVKVLKVREDNELEGYRPSQINIYGDDATGKPLYPLMRTVYIVSTAANNSVGHSFYSFVTGFIGQKILLMTGILPYHVHPRVIQLE